MSTSENDILALAQSGHADTVEELSKVYSRLEPLTSLEGASFETRRQLTNELQKLSRKIIKLRECEINNILNSPDVQNALGKLKGITSDVKETAKEMVNATEALKRVGSIVALADRAIKIFGG